MYIYHNNHTCEIVPFTTIKAVSIHVGINYDTLLYHFSRLKKNEYKTEDFKIVKADPISIKRK